MAEAAMAKFSKLKVKTPIATLPDWLKYIPLPHGDPIGPIDLGPEVAKELTTLRLQHQRAVIDLQSKALDQALAIVKKAR
jgi:hypothetical protein